MPDVVVTRPDSPGVVLVAEAKHSQFDADETESQLKSYMLLMGCPVGVILTPEIIRIYRDRFTENNENSVQLVGSFPAQMLFESLGQGGASETMLGSLLRNWLDRVAVTGEVHLSDPHIKDMLIQNIVPAVSGGTVSFAKPTDHVGPA